MSTDQSILVKQMFCGHQSSPWTCRFKSVLDIFCHQGICHTQRFLPEFASHSTCRVLNKSDPRRCSQRGQTFRASLEAQTWEHTIVSNPFRPLKCNLSNREDLFFSLNWEVFVRQDFCSEWTLDFTVGWTQITINGAMSFFRSRNGKTRVTWLQSEYLRGFHGNV